MQIPRDLKTKVNEIIDEGDGTYFVWLNKGWAFDPDEDEAKANHCSGMFSGVSEIRRAVRGVAHCPCQWCRS